MGRVPLYRGVEIPSLPEGGNAGLWYDKFCHAWDIPSPLDGKKRQGDLKVDKKEWIDTVAGRGNKHGTSRELKHRSERQRKITESLKGRYLDLETAGPFVTGLGRQHPVENGFLWHHTLGVPYLPGSSVKGMVRAWAEHWEETEEENRQRIVGSQSRAGEVTFFDALPTQPVSLKADVLTPHYGDYYHGSKLPGDWISPVPILFLVVGEGNSFRFAVAPRSDRARTHCEMACDWLQSALEWIGAGAKTAVGYGRFEKAGNKPSRGLEQLQKKQPVEATLYKDQKNRWCGRINDKQQGTVFGSAPSDATVDKTWTLYVRDPNPRALQFQWELPEPKPSPDRRKPGRRPGGPRRRH